MCHIGRVGSKRAQISQDWRTHHQLNVLFLEPLKTVHVSGVRLISNTLPAIGCFPYTSFTCAWRLSSLGHRANGTTFNVITLHFGPLKLYMFQGPNLYPMSALFFDPKAKWLNVHAPSGRAPQKGSESGHPPDPVARNQVSSGQRSTGFSNYAPQYTPNVLCKRV